MAITSKQLGQLRPANTTAASLYSPGAGVVARIMDLIICETAGATAKFRIFVDDDGSTYDESTALYWDFVIAADSTIHLKDLGIFMNDATGNLAVRTDTNNALTFTAFGIEIS